MRFTPILLNGPGGVGKTMFAEALAASMGHKFHRISVSSSQNGAALAGSSSFFANAKPGVPFTSLVDSEYANQLIFLDEIDKNTTGSYDALGALYVLLEPSTARYYKDQCYDIEIDASHLLYLAASNDASQIPEAMMSRFKIFDIGITAEQSLTIAQSIATSTLESFLPATEGMQVSQRAIEQLASLTPRRMKHAMIDAIGAAFTRDELRIEKLILTATTSRRIGFV